MKRKKARTAQILARSKIKCREMKHSNTVVSKVVHALETQPNYQKRVKLTDLKKSFYEAVTAVDETQDNRTQQKR